MLKTTDCADFIFIIEWLAHNNININESDDIDELYKDYLKSYAMFEASPQFLQFTSYLQAVKDYLNN